MNRKSLTAVAAGLASLGLVGVAASTGVASSGASAPAAPRQVAAQGGVTAQAVTSCDGGRSLRLYTRMSADPFSFPGSSYALKLVPGAKVQLTGPSTGTDTVLVTFSAETYYTGSGWLGISATKNGIRIQPYANNGSPYAMNSSHTYQGNSAQFCTKIGRGTHILAIKAYTTGGAGDAGWIDDWTMSVQRFE
jgi:hypothetical protein